MKSGYWVAFIGALVSLAIALPTWCFEFNPQLQRVLEAVYFSIFAIAFWLATTMVAVEKGYNVGLGFFVAFLPALGLFVLTLLLGIPQISLGKGYHIGPGLFVALLSVLGLFVLALLPQRRDSSMSGLHSPLFDASMWLFVALFTGGLLALIFADVGYTNRRAVAEVLESPEIGAALWLSLWTSVLTVLIGLLFAIPMGYALSRYRFPGHVVIDSIVDLPILLPPLIVGLSLLVFFQTEAGRWIEGTGLTFVFQTRGIVLCQFLVSASFGIRVVKVTFDGIDPRIEHVAMTLGCTRLGAFFRVALPMARRGIIAGAILIWTRAFGIFGPLMVFVGAVRNRTEVLPTTIYLEQSVGRIEVALAVAVLMLVLAAVALVGIRMVGLGQR